jgi:ribonuclease D
MALPGKNGDAVLVDPIEGSQMSMEPLYDLFRHKATVKVFHAARQDLEIFFVEGNVFPDPLFDTQVAAMVCGFCVSTLRLVVGLRKGTHRFSVCVFLCKSRQPSGLKLMA